MKWLIILTATFLMLNHNAMSHRHRWHRQWLPNFHHHEFSRNEGYFSGDGISQNIDFSNGPDFHKIDSSEFVPYHTHHHHHHHNCPYHKSHRNVYETTTTTESTWLEPSTITAPESTTESTTKFKIEPREKRTIRPKIESTTAPIIKSTTTQLITTTDSTRDFLNCILFCPVTSEYNPVCGTNFVTYTNPGRLICAKNCGLAVEILKTSPCPTNTPQIIPTTQSPSTTTTATTTTTTTAKTTSETSSQQQCISSCERSTEWRPLCGSNDVTYNNTQDLMCAQYCGVDVRLKKFSACTDTDRELTTSTTQKTIEKVSNVGSSSTLPPNTQSCFRSCSVTSEYNPVCGTNDVTYRNPSFLQCLQTCGINVYMKHMSSCVNNNNGNNNNQQTTTSIPVQITTSSPLSVSLCIKVCPILSEDKPICGTNGVTYKNPSHLQCAKTCGVNVQIKHKQSCPQENNINIETSSVNQLQPTTTPSKFNQDTCIDACNKNPVYYPVCGSNNVTYNNLEHLQCAISCQVDVSLETFSSCTESNSVMEITTIGNPENVLTTSTTTNGPEISKEPPFMGVTINSDVLNMIFDIPTTTESQGGEIDPRFGDVNATLPI